MGHPEVDNETPFAFEPLFLTDEQGKWVLVPLAKASFELSTGAPVLAKEQQPMFPGGLTAGEPGKSSYLYEPEYVLPKPATDIVLIASAMARSPNTSEMLVTFQVGSIKKSIRVLGERVFFKTRQGIGMTRPVAFERMPLVWERAFGGWDRSHPDPAKHSFEPRNPVGVGFHDESSVFQDGLRCPNLENPVVPFKGWGDHPAPVGFGFTSPDWEPRRLLGGTYDEKWQEECAPMLPSDFDPRFVNAAAPGLVANGYLRGDEPVGILGVTGSGALSFRLPAVAPPSVGVTQGDRPDVVVRLKLDTVVVNTETMVLSLYWRGRTPVREPTLVRSIEVLAGEGTPLPAPADVMST